MLEQAPQFPQDGIINVRRDYGAAGDGTTDDTSRIQAALTAANASTNTKIVFLPAGNYKISSSLTIPGDGISLIGSGQNASFLIFPTAAAFDLLVATGRRGVRIADLAVIGGGLAPSGNYDAVKLNTCTESTVERVFAQDGDDKCILLLDCDRSRVVNCTVQWSDALYAANSEWTGILLDGCSSSMVIGCHARQTRFGIAVIANDGLGGAGNGSESVRTRTDCTSNTIAGCTVEHFKVCGIDINGCDGNSVVGSNVSLYEGSSSTDPAFQNKHSTGGTQVDCRGNVFSGCTARDVAAAFYSQRGSRLTYNACTVKNSQTHAFWLNNCPYGQITACQGENIGSAGTGAYAVRIEGGSHYANVDGVIIDSNANLGTMVGVSIAASTHATIDHIIYVNNWSVGVEIDATSDYTMIGQGVRVFGLSITDATATTQYTPYGTAGGDLSGMYPNPAVKWATPGTIGSTTPSTGKFTTISATSLSVTSASSLGTASATSISTGVIAASGVCQFTNQQAATSTSTGTVVITGVGGLAVGGKVYTGDTAFIGTSSNPGNTGQRLIVVSPTAKSAGTIASVAYFGTGDTPGANDLAFIMRLGCTTAASAEWAGLQSYDQAIGVKPLVFQDLGGRVLIGTVTDDGTNLLQIAGTQKVSGTTDSTSSSTGAIICLGGGAFQKNVVAAQGLGVGVASTATAAATTTMTSASKMVQVFTGATTQSVQLPAANIFGSGIGARYVIKNRSSGNVTILRAGADTIDGATSLVLTGGLNSSADLVSDGVSEWEVT